MAEVTAEVVKEGPNGASERLQLPTTPSSTTASSTSTVLSLSSVSIPSSSQPGSVIVSAGSAASETGGSSSPQLTKLPKPPPLIAMANISTADFTPKAPATLKPKIKTEEETKLIKKETGATGLTKVESASESVKVPVSKPTASAVSLDPVKLEVVAKKSPGSSPASVGGLGAGKPKAFLAMMSNASTPKKQTKKPAASSGGASAGRGQGSKSKSSPLSGSASKKAVADVVPSRTSNRNIKRPRTYEEEMDEMRAAAKASAAKKAKGSSKVTKVSAKKTTSATVPSSGIKDLGRWRPTDDLMLISAVQQTNDLSAVHLGVNFSCRFTLQEVEERWHALLYNPRLSQLAIDAIQGLHPGVVTMALNNALWSQEEEAVLARIPPTDPGHLEKFQAVLRENPAVFHTCRTATSLHHHWVLMGHNNLLNTQKVDLIPPLENIKEFGDAEDHLEEEVTKPRDVREEAMEQELIVSDRHAKMEIMKLEEELPLWRTVIETGSPPEFGPNDYALFKGKIVEFRMSKRTVFFGRSTANNTVDFDLSLEGPAFKVSRRQAMVQLTDGGDFMLYNEGKRPMYVSGKVVLPRTSTRLQHNQIIEITSMAFLVSLNLKLANSLKGST